MAAFEQARAGRVIDSMCEHARTHFPAAADAEPAALHRVVTGAVAQARALGVKSERGMLRYLNLVLEYGPRFRESPRLSWMKGYLDDPRVPDAEERIARLHTAAAVRRERSMRPR
jgi:hypothetical protein